MDCKIISRLLFLIVVFTSTHLNAIEFKGKFLQGHFIVGFTAHGPSKRAAADPTIRGGCYADAGNCRIWWDQTANGEQEETDGEKLKRFVSGLPPRSIVRHHVAGDIGAE